MVNFTDLKLYKSTSGLGGAITANTLQTGTPNNLFVNFTRNQIESGSTKYKCFYLKNESVEDMENFKIWISSGTPLDYTHINFGFDALANPFDAAIGFDGINDYVDCGDDSALWSRAKSKFSFLVEMWPTQGGDGNSRNIVNHAEGLVHGFTLQMDPTDSTKIKFTIKDSAHNNHTVIGTIEQDEWNDVICSYDNSLGSTNMRIYVNGELHDTASLTETINASDSLDLGGGSNDFEGYIRDFKFWHDQSINEDEAEELYETDELSNSPESYHLTFGERTGGTTKDQVSKTKTATLNGAFWKNDAQTIGDTFTSPALRRDHWYESGEIESKTFRLKPGFTIPIWVRVTVDPDSSAQPHLDDNGIFTIRFEITSTGTGSSGTPGTGGGTGGTPGGSGTTNYKIAFAGDWGNTGDTTDVVNLMKSQDYDLIIGVGDNAYDDSSASSWCSKFNTFKSKMESAFGNHEYEEDGGIGPYKNFFGYSKTYNSFRFQNCLILILDSNDDKNGVDLDAQRTWAKAELEKYKNDAQVVWRIAVMHHPWFGSGAKHEENEFDQVQKFHKMFTDYDVNFIYTGHNHHWQRSHQVAYNSSDPTDPNVVDSSSPYTRTGNGIIHIVSGTGGHDGPGDLYSLSDDDSFWAYRNKNNNGVHELVASNGGNTLTGRFRNVDNNTSDTFTITA